MSHPNFENASHPKSDVIRQQIVVKPKAGGFLWSFIIFSIPGFISGLIWMLISVIVLILVISGIGANSVKSEENQTLKLKTLQTSSKSEGILVYDLEGAIISGGGDLSTINRTLGVYTEVVENDFKEIKNNKNIKNVVFRLNTPGGEIYASEILGDLINDLLISKNQSQGVFYFDQLAASGGLWATYKNLNNYVVGSKYGETGSVGVILTLPNFKGLAEKVGYSENVIKSSNSKDIGNPLRDITPEERGYFQVEVDKKYDKFLDLVATGRRIPKDKVKTFATGKTFENTEAKDFGLIDEIGNLDTAIKKAASNTSLGDNYIVWTVKNDTGLLESLFGANGIAGMLGIPQNATKVLDKATFFDSGKIYLIDEYKI
jgi:protease IV